MIKKALAVLFIGAVFFMWTGLTAADSLDVDSYDVDSYDDSEETAMDVWDKFFDENLELTLEVLNIITDHNVEQIVPDRRGLDGQTALHLISRSGYTPMAEFFIKEMSANIELKNDKGNTPLLEMVCARKVNLNREQSMEMAQVLLENGADVNEQNDKGQTVVHCLAVSGHWHLLPLYKTHGADLSIKDSSGSTAEQFVKYASRSQDKPFPVE